MHNTYGRRPHGRRARPQRGRRRLAVGSAGAARTGPPTKPTRHATGTTDAPTGEHSAVRGMNIHDAPAKCDTTLPMRCRGGRQERAPQPRSRHPHKVSLRAKVRPPNTGSYGISVFLQSWVPRARGTRHFHIALAVPCWAGPDSRHGNNHWTMLGFALRPREIFEPSNNGRHQPPPKCLEMPTKTPPVPGLK
jgi:hypothetical protein